MSRQGRTEAPERQGRPTDAGAADDRRGTERPDGFSEASETDARLVFATAFFHSDIQAPNARTTDAFAKYRMYYRCMVVMFASVRAAYPDSRCVCFVDVPIEGVERSLLDALGVEQVSCAPTFVTSSRAVNAFPGCLYTLDVLDCFPARFPGSTLILLDSDVVLRARIDAFIAACERAGRIGALDQPFELNYPSNGHTRASLSLMSSIRSGVVPPEPLVYLGGELYVVPPDVGARIALEIRSFLEWFDGAGRSTFGDALTEEHVLTVLAGAMGGAEKATGVAKRIWTTRNHANVDGTEGRLAIWHLPAQKRSGFQSMFARIAQTVARGEPLSVAQVRQWADECMRLHRWRPDGFRQRALGPLARLRRYVREA